METLKTIGMWTSLLIVIGMCGFYVFNRMTVWGLRRDLKTRQLTKAAFRQLQADIAYLHKTRRVSMAIGSFVAALILYFSYK